MLEVLLDGHPRSATELSIISRAAFSTASNHLGRLVEAGFVDFERNGRHRFYRISEPRVSDVIEAMYEFLPNQKGPPARLLTEIEAARTCYDHLAGRLGSALTDAMISRGYLTPNEKEFLLSADGQSVLLRVGNRSGGGKASAQDVRAALPGLDGQARPSGRRPRGSAHKALFRDGMAAARYWPAFWCSQHRKATGRSVSALG